VVWCADAALVATQAISQVANVGVTLGTVTGLSLRCCMVCVLLRNKRVAGRAISVGGHTFMALITQTLGIKLRLMVTRRDIRTMT
jgi:hypothetical protein